MSVTMKGTTALNDFLSLFDVDPALITTAVKNGVVVVQEGLGNYVVTKGEKQYGVVAVKGQAITLAKNNALGPASKKAIKFQFEGALEKAIAASVEPVLVSFAAGIDPVIGDVKSEGYAGLQPLGIVEEQSISDKIAGVHTVLAQQLKGGKTKSPQKLASVKECYVPVLGTSHGSIYFSMAMLDGMNLAVRIKSKTLSIRAEGSKLNAYAAALNELGFSIKEKYASVHYEVSELTLVLKTFGAVVARLGLSNLKAIGDPETVIGEGV